MKEVTFLQTLEALNKYRNIVNNSIPVNQTT